MLDQLEMDLHDQINREFIDADPEVLDIYRAARQSDGAGGSFALAPTPVVLGATFRLIPQSRNSTDQTSQTSNGQLETPRYVIMALVDHQWQRGDFFDWRGLRWQISSVHQFPYYEHKADVVLVGEVPDE